MATSPFEHVRILSDEIGSRMVGTPGNRAAADYISGVFQRAGLQVERQAQPCPEWSDRETCLTLAGRPVEAYANTFSPACEVSGPLLPLGTLAQLDSADLPGKIVVLYGELVQGPLSPKGFFYASERDLQLIAKLEVNPPAAVITVNPVLGMRTRMIEDPDLAIPSATVPLDAGLELVRQAGASAQLKIDASRAQGSSDNIIARIPGSGAKRIVVCAHYDTKPDTPGALDNACGVAVLLSLAERLARIPRSAELELVAFTNEEFYTSPEADVYFQAVGPRFGELVAAINIDGIGSSVSATNMATFAGSAAFEEAVESVRAGCMGVYRTDPWPASNHYLFFSNGVPSVAISSGGLYYAAVHHSPEDTIRWVGEEKLEEVLDLVTNLLSVLDEKDPAWGRASE